MPEAVPALLVGCLLSTSSAAAPFSISCSGSLATLLAAVCTRRLRDKFWLAALMPVLFNGVIVGAVVHFCYSPAIALPLCMLSVAAGEARRVSGRRPAAHQRTAPHARFRAELNSFSS